MKTLLDIKQQILHITHEQPRGWKKQLARANEIKMYLETNPNAEFLNKEENRLQARYWAIMELRPEPAKGTDEKNPEFKKILKHWEDENGIPKLKQQLKAIKYILS